MKKKNYFTTVILYIVVGAFVFAFMFIYYFNREIGPGLIKCASDEVKHLTILVMNNCVRKYIEESSEIELLKIERDHNNDIERLGYDIKVLNQTKSRIVEVLENDLVYMVRGELDEIDFNLNKLSDEYYEINEEGILYTVSIGSVTGNSFLANIGPKIPLNLQVNGDVMADIHTEVKEYGLNNALIESKIELSVTMIINMPFLSEKIVVENAIPLSIEIIQGNIPGYYLGGVETE